MKKIGCNTANSLLAGGSLSSDYTIRFGLLVGYKFSRLFVLFILVIRHNTEIILFKDVP